MIRFLIPLFLVPLSRRCIPFSFHFILCFYLARRIISLSIISLRFYTIRERFEIVAVAFGTFIYDAHFKRCKHSNWDIDWNKRMKLLMPDSLLQLFSMDMCG